jgi:hypothetical protein
MLGLPEFGDRAWVWPTPGRMVQDGPLALDADSGGRWLAKGGREVAWSAFYLEQYRAGDLHLHDPRSLPADKE